VWKMTTIWDFNLLPPCNTWHSWGMRFLLNLDLWFWGNFVPSVIQHFFPAGQSWCEKHSRESSHTMWSSTLGVKNLTQEVFIRQSGNGIFLEVWGFWVEISASLETFDPRLVTKKMLANLYYDSILQIRCFKNDKY